MKFLKLVNFPLNLIQAPKYGKPEGSSRIPFEACGISKTAIAMKSVQYQEFDGDKNHITYLPITDEAKFDEKLPLMQEDLATLQALDPDKTFAIEKVEDDFSAWKATSEAEKQLAKDSAQA